MLRPRRWIVSVPFLGLVLFASVLPEARTAEPGLPLPVPLSPTVPLNLRGCATVDARYAFESADCLQATRLELIEGRITLLQAIRRVEACAGNREDIAELVSRAALLRADMIRARIAYGEELSPVEQGDYQRLLEELGVRHTAPPADAVQRLRDAGISPDGFDSSRASAILRRLAADRGLRRDFRAVFGDRQADVLDSIIARDVESPTALILGGTVVMPNLPAAYPVEDGGIGIPEGETEPQVIGIEAYTARVATELAATEWARTSYLASASHEHRRIASIESFLQSITRRAEVAVELDSLRHEVDQAASVLLARLTNLERQLGLEPLLQRSAEESVSLAATISEACAVDAQERHTWIRRGAGILVGLFGAAGLVIATGSTGTLIGGVTIAAAIEAGIGAYLIARSEEIAAQRTYALAEDRQLPEEEEQRQIRRRRDGSFEFASGRGDPAGSANEEFYEDVGERDEAEGLEGEGIESEEEGSTGATPRRNTVPPVLPPEPEERLRELPPLLATPVLQRLREMTLPEIQERLDEFLARNDPAALANFTEDDVLEPMSLRALIDEAQAALDLWEAQRILAERFGQFFIQAELERAPANQRSQTLLRAMGRYAVDRELYTGSRDITDLRRRVASRLVAHCRTNAAPGDLVLRACTDETALSILLVAALRETGAPVPEGSEVGIQAFDTRFEAVLYSRENNQVFSLTRGTSMEGVVAPIYYPAIFYYTYLLTHGVVPEIDVDQHLLMALPDRPMPPDMEAEECRDSRNLVTRAVDWLGRMIGIRRVGLADPCRQASGDEGGGRRARGRQGGVDVTVPSPPNPLRGGGGQSGGGSGGGGGGGGNPLAAGRPDPMGSSSSSGDGSSGSGEREGSEQGSQGAEANDSIAAATGNPEASGEISADSTAAQAGDGSGQGGQGGGREPGVSEGEASADPAGQGGGSGGYSAGVPTLPQGPNLAGLGREAARIAEEYEDEPRLEVMPWRLREDQGMLTGSGTRVLYAANARALERFDEDDLFITLAPAEVEAQRRMLEADTFPVFDADADCESEGLPPRRVFRRAAANEEGFRYVYCDHDESMVIFRDRNDANSYAGLSPPDRPLFLARLGAERLARFERTEEVALLRQFLDDPNMLRRHSRDEIYAMVKTVNDLLVFQNTLESALVQSMNELGPSAVRSHYFELHRQVLQAPLFIEMAERVYRLNRRLASDPLQTLAWANAQPRLARQGFFDLYYTLGGMMTWPQRWAILQQRYGDGEAPPPMEEEEIESLDFLQILSDPVRVQVDWNAERTGNPSIRDTRVQEGAEHSPVERDEPTLATETDRENDTKHQRGGTGGLGHAGQGESIGPEQGRRPPLQMIHIRVVPQDGDPDRPRLPDENSERSGGTEGEKRTQTEESSSRQEPALWVSPHTFIEAILSPWDTRVLDPATADRIPPILRFNERLRDLFLRELYPADVYNNRLRTAMGVFSRSGWLRYSEVRDAMGGDVVAARAVDTGRFSAAYSGNPPINDQDQIRIPNFFSKDGVIIPADLFDAVRRHYRESLLGIFDLARSERVPAAVPLSSLPVPPGEAAQEARRNLLWSLDVIEEQARAR